MTKGLQKIIKQKQISKIIKKQHYERVKINGQRKQGVL